MRKVFIVVMVWIPACLYARHHSAVELNQKQDTVLIKQFDGSTLHVVCDGNIYISYCETTDGYTLVLDDIGIYEYAARGKKGDLVPIGMPAKDEGERDRSEKRKLFRIKKHLRYKGQKLEELKENEKKDLNDPAIIKRHKVKIR